MKREELTAMGLTDEQIEKIIAENSKDVQAANAKANKNSEELTRLLNRHHRLSKMTAVLTTKYSEKLSLKKKPLRHRLRNRKLQTIRQIRAVAVQAVIKELKNRQMLKMPKR